MLNRLTFLPNFTDWQKAARKALSLGLKPEQIFWQELGTDKPLLDLDQELEQISETNFREKVFKVPKSFIEIAKRVACYRGEEKWSLLYRIPWRITHGESNLLQISVDPDVHDLNAKDKAIRHDVHKMRAFVRFRKVKRENGFWFVAWFEPQHHIVELNAPFFRDRFAQMHWSILTPDKCAHWNGEKLSFTNGVTKKEAPTEDEVEKLWINYYSNIFNPARVKIHAMQAEMPKHYWKNLPETKIIPDLLKKAPRRVNKMIKKRETKGTPENFF